MFCFLPANFLSSTYTEKNSPFFLVNEQTLPIVRGSYSARVPRSSLAGVHEGFVHHIVEEEADGQEEKQDDRRQDRQQEEEK